MPSKVLWIFLSVLPIITCQQKWNATFEPQHIELFMDHSKGPVNLTLYGFTSDILDPSLINDKSHLTILSSQPDVSEVVDLDSIKFEEVSKENGIWRTEFHVHGSFLGNWKFSSKFLQFLNP